MDPHLANPPKPSGGRISKLFIRGKAVNLGQDEYGDVWVWVQALTKSQHEEATMAAALVSTRKRLAFKAGNEDYDLLIEQMELEASVDDLVDGIIAARHMNIIWLEAEQDLHADPAWRDGNRLDLIRMGDAQIKSGVEISNEEAAALADLNTEYTADWRKYATARLATKKAELSEKPRDELEQLYIDAAISIQTINVQADEYNGTAIYYALRHCQSADGSKHDTCDNHRTQHFREIADVRMAPDELKDAVIAALADLDSAADVLGGLGPQAASA